DTSLRLGTMCSDVTDPELLEHFPELRGTLPPRKLLLFGPMGVVADQDVRSIPVDRQGQAMVREHLAEHFGVSVQIFMRPELQAYNHARRIVHRPDQREMGLCIANPSEGTPVDQNQSSSMGLSDSSPSVLRWPSA